MRPMHRGAATWLAAAAVLALLAGLLWPAPRDALDWQPALAGHEPWRAWTAAFVHLSPSHLAANLAGCAVVGAFGAAARVPPRCTLAWLAAWPLTHAALAWQPGLQHYGGLSGVLHGGVAIAAWHLLRRDAGRPRVIGALVLAGLAIKIALERPWGPPTRLEAGWDFAVAPLAHASGAGAGWLCALAADAWPRRTR